MEKNNDKNNPIKVSSLSLINKDDRGSTFGVENDRSGHYILAYRKAGSSSGRHYHTGKSANKNPEILYLLSGEATIKWRYLEEKEIHEVKVSSPAKVEILINIWHELVPLSDCSFLEMNSLEDVQQDSIRIE